MGNVLTIENVVKYYKKKKALDGITMSIDKGDIYGFVGENGSGKTTVIRLITGLISSNSGSFKLFDVDGKSKDITNVRRKIGAIVENPSIYGNLNAKDNILMQGQILGIDVADKVKDILQMVGLGELYQDKKKASNFSLGMRQRLGIAMCLVGDPEFIILDEPMNGLDPQGIVEIRELILKLNKEHNLTFLISSHILTELSLVATKYGIISKGRMIKEISNQELNYELKKKIILKIDNYDLAILKLSEFIKEEDLNYNNLELTVSGDYDINGILKTLVNNNIIIYDIKTHEANIEDYYLNLVGGVLNA